MAFGNELDHRAFPRRQRIGVALGEEGAQQRRGDHTRKERLVSRDRLYGGNEQVRWRRI